MVTPSAITNAGVPTLWAQDSLPRPDLFVGTSPLIGVDTNCEGKTSPLRILLHKFEIVSDHRYDNPYFYEIFI